MKDLGLINLKDESLTALLLQMQSITLHVYLDNGVKQLWPKTCYSTGPLITLNVSFSGFHQCTHKLIASKRNSLEQLVYQALSSITTIPPMNLRCITDLRYTFDQPSATITYVVSPVTTE